MSAQMGGRAVVLRPADWRDIPAMSRVERRVFAADPWSEASLWAELAQRPRRTYLVAAGHGIPAGGELFGHAGLDLAGEVADVMTVAVDPAVRGQGLGARLLAALHARARAAGARSVLLEVRADNESARALYGTRGYEVVRTRPGYYQDGAGAGSVDALVMRKELAADG